MFYKEDFPLLFKINKFIFYSVNKNLLICQSESGIVKIHNRLLIDFLKGLEAESRGGGIITYDEIQEYFLEESDDVIDFLMSHNLISEKNESNFNIRQVLLISNSPEVKSMIINNINENIEVDTIDIDEIGHHDKFKENTLIVMFLNPYIKSKAKLVRDAAMNSKNCFVLTSYMYNDSFYLDAVFSPEWKTPCHICNMGILDETISHNRISKNYKDFIDNLMNQYPEFTPESVLNKRKVINIAAFMINKIEAIVGLDVQIPFDLNDFKNNYQLDLDLQKSFTDTSIHWELCDCYE
ncbi:McbB family protein [Exiguobacterium sp. BMC-KP]|uniref:McbB family protein n=1 Tax=Exiguobacterium sp. BMC-KP TaxID=1684312 RepID=UPI001F1DC94E|nr:McbB family protein [Exiguobacterium sp. BMC-KP]